MPNLQLAIYLDDNRSEFSPDDTVSGTAKINARGGETAKDSIDVYLFWRTKGRGDEDHGVAGHLRILEDGASVPTMEIEKNFEFQLPALPCTYTGVALKIEWVLGIYARVKGGDKQEVEIPLVVKPRSAGSV